MLMKMKKTIYKYGIRFGSFADIKRFENEVSNAGIKLTDEEINNIKFMKEIYKNYKYK